MSQSNAQQVRAGGGIDVYTGLLAGAFLVLAVGVGMLAMKNIEHSKVDSSEGGVLQLVE